MCEHHSDDHEACLPWPETLETAQEDWPIQHLTSDLDGENTKLAAQLSEAQATIDILQASKLALSNQVALLEAELSKALEALKVEQSRSAECKGNSQTPIFRLCDSVTHATLCNFCDSV